jgi:pyruvate/2-oxoglutarate dehydrogenase complex dihydrolipoamide dehydrogenase (E3) component
VAYEYDMTVIGGGAAGLTASGIAASLGAKTALIEVRRLGGDCTWYGCVPSKALLKAAKVRHTAATADRYGLRAFHPEFQFDELMRRVHEVQNFIYEDADAPPVFEKLGVEVIEGSASFLDPHTLDVKGPRRASERLQSRYFVVATGSAPVIPPIEGIAATRYLTNETLFSLDRLPERLIIVGGGPVGVEIAQAFRRLDSEVQLVASAERILPRDNPELSGLLQEQLEQEGIRFLLRSRAVRVEGSNKVRVGVEGPSPQTFEGDAVLIAAGRRSNVAELRLENAGVAAGKQGVTVDRHCRTSARHIYASGDVTGLYRYTHMAEHMSKIAVSNALLHLPLSIDNSGVAWCTYTDPELAHVGLSEEEVRSRGGDFGVYRFPYSKIDRAITDGQTAGMIKVFARKFGGKIYGATILGANAGDLISEYSLAVRNGITLRQIADTIHPYPTYALGNRRAADQWYVCKQSRTLVRWIQRIFGYRGQLPDTSEPGRII